MNGITHNTEVRLFGAAEAVRADGEQVRFGRGPARRVVSHLALLQPHVVSTATLLEAGWPDGELRRPEASLRMAITRLRRSIGQVSGQQPVAHGPGGYRLVDAVEVDVRTFEREVVSSRGMPPTSAVVSRLTSALDLWRGVPYEDGEGTEFTAERQRLGALRVEAALRLESVAIDLGDVALGIDHLQRVIADHPLHDGLIALRMRSLYLLGDQSGALRAYDAFRQRLVDEQGIEPSPELQALQLRILRHEVPARRWDSPGVSLRSPGIGWVVAPVPEVGGVAADGEPPADTVVARRAESSARLGHWDDAAGWYQEAVELALQAGRHDAAVEHCLQLAHVVWDPVLGAWTADRLHRLAGLTTSELARARITLCLAGGLYRSGYEAAEVRPDRLWAALAVLDGTATPEALAWGITHLRDALSGELPAAQALSLTDRVLALGVDDELLQGQTWRAKFSLHLRVNHRGAAGVVLRSMRRAEPSALAANRFGLQASQNCWDLAFGRWGKVQQGLDRLLEFGGRLASSTVDQVVLAQSFWLCRELQQPEALRNHRRGALALAADEPGVPHWLLAAALMALDAGDVDLAEADLAAATEHFDLGAIPAGSHRLGVLALAAEVMAGLAGHGRQVHRHLATLVGKGLLGDGMRGVVFGWPAVFAGPVSRFVAFAHVAAGRLDEAEAAFRQAIVEDRWMPPHRCRSEFALGQLLGSEGEDLRANSTLRRHGLLDRAGLAPPPG